jgi:hypothetical protein
VIFIVHGHDLAFRDEVAAAVRVWVPCCEVQILASEPKRARTVIGALVQILPEADFIIALATGDDVVRPRDRPRAKATLAARPNVIFEVGAAAMTNVRWMLIKDPEYSYPATVRGAIRASGPVAGRGPAGTARRRPTRRPRRHRLTHPPGEPLEVNESSRAIRSPRGPDRRRPPRGSPTERTAAAGMWAAAGCGDAATTMVAAPPNANRIRPAGTASGSPAAVTTWQTPSTNRPTVMIHRSSAPRAASALMVSRIGSNPPNCRVWASVQPPISATGAAAADTNTQLRTCRVCPTRRPRRGPRTARHWPKLHP